MKPNEIMDIGAERARITMRDGFGGPFGAVITKDGEIISVASNTVIFDNDPTAHAEMNAIRDACETLGTYDLSGCELWATGYPCPMCMSAIIWANIKKVYVSGSLAEAEAIGFRDDHIYAFLQDRSDTSVVDIVELNDGSAKSLYDEYRELSGTIY